MSDKSMLCNGCGSWAANGANVDTGDGLGALWTCPECAALLRIIYETAPEVVTEDTP